MLTAAAAVAISKLVMQDRVPLAEMHGLLQGPYGFFAPVALAQLCGLLNQRTQIVHRWRPPFSSNLRSRSSPDSGPPRVRKLLSRRQCTSLAQHRNRRLHNDLALKRAR